MQLSTRWWHRLARVLLFVILGVTSAFGLLVFQDNSVPDDLTQITVKTNLREFTKSQPPTIPNTIPAFLESPGDLGAIKDDMLIWLSSSNLGKGICSADLLKNADAMAANLNSNYPSVRGGNDDRRRGKVFA